MQPGNRFQVKGNILLNAKEFAVNLGKDSDNIACCFNPRFASHDGLNLTLLNSKQDGVWGDEMQHTLFPYKRGDNVKIIFAFHGSEIKVRVEDCYETFGVGKSLKLVKGKEGYFVKEEPLGGTVTYNPCRWNLELFFPNRLGLTEFNYLSVEGDFKVKGLKAL
ncbi:16 kDa beta-galactoside-binding lectin-like isoform X2 [Hemicordylus capensis]|nr:16 kDa beta-galactoside-binding lectin-like isoform X2 [Hemicordylus capensis]